MSKKGWIGLIVALVVGLLAGAGAMTLISGAQGGEPQIHNAQLKVGDAAPDFRLPNQKGGYVRLSEFRGEKNVVIAFYPLAWTPV